jgi:hypothetical protein
MNKQDLEKQLTFLRTKWKTFPKSVLDKDWCSFRVDKSKALSIIEQIKKIDAGIEITAEDLTQNQAEEIFK